jgi:hypothetical protein
MRMGTMRTTERNEDGRAQYLIQPLDMFTDVVLFTQLEAMTDDLVTTSN